MKEKKKLGHDDRISLQAAIAKGLAPAKVELLFSHINSYVRDSNERRAVASS